MALDIARLPVKRLKPFYSSRSAMALDIARFSVKRLKPFYSSPECNGFRHCTVIRKTSKAVLLQPGVQWLQTLHGYP